MGATAVDKKLNIIDKTNTIREIELYDDTTKFADYDDGGYFSIYDGTAYRYAYCSSHLYTNSEGNPTNCLICEFIGKDGSLRYMYTQQPNEIEELVETFTTSSTDAFDLIDNKDEFPHGAFLYLVNTKGNNGGNGNSGGGGWTAYDSNVGTTRYYRGEGGSGGSGGTGGKGLELTLQLADFLEDGTPDFDNSITTDTITHYGEVGAGGGGGGGGAGYYVLSGSGSPGSGGTMGYANIPSKTNRIKIPRDVAVKCSSLTTNIQANSGNKGSNGGGGDSYINTTAITGGSGGAGGSNGLGQSGSGGSGYSNWNGGRGGNGASVNTEVTKTTVNQEVNGKIVHTDTITNSSNYAIANDLATTSGMALAKLILQYDE